MKRQMSWLLVGLLLVSFLAGAGPAAAQGPVTLEVYDPTGAIEVTELHAPRLDTLAGKTICEASDDQWESWRTFPLIRELLQRQFPTAKFIPHTEVVPTRAQLDDPEYVSKIVKEKGCDAVIVGNAG